MNGQPTFGAIKFLYWLPNTYGYSRSTRICSVSPCQDPIDSPSPEVPNKRAEGREWGPPRSEFGEASGSAGGNSCCSLCLCHIRPRPCDTVIRELFKNAVHHGPLWGLIQKAGWAPNSVFLMNNLVNTGAASGEVEPSPLARTSTP